MEKSGALLLKPNRLLTGKVLVAASASCEVFLRSALAGYDLIFVEDCRAALSCEEEVVLRIVEIQFDNSSAVELIRKLSDDNGRSSLLVIRLRPTRLEKFINTVMGVLQRSQIIDGYVEAEGKPEKLKAVVEKLLTRS